MTPSVLCGALEIALNRHLAQDPAVLEDCARLKGRALQFNLSGLDWSFVIELCPQGVRVAPLGEGAIEVSVTAPPTLLLRMLRQHAQGNSGIPQGLRVEGDPELLTRFNQLLARAGFDPEEILSKYLGDAFGPRAWQGISGFFGWSRQTADTLALDTAEYLREETRDLARASDAGDWMNQVDDLRDGVERFEARLLRAESRT